MTSKKNYTRYFIILQEDEKGYALDKDKTPSGYVKLEKKNNKCKISYYVQNINPNIKPYYMVLICGNKDANKIIRLGKINLEDSGRLDISNEYDAENIVSSGFSVESVKGAALVKIIDNNLISLMSGFTSSDIPRDWKSYELLNSQREEEGEKENIFDKYEDNIEKTRNKDEIEHKEKENDENLKEEDITKVTIEKENKRVEEKNVLEEHEKREVDIEQNLSSQKEEAPRLEEKEILLNDYINKYSKEETEEVFVTSPNVSELENQDDFRSKKHKCECNYKEEDFPLGEMGDYFKALACELKCIKMAKEIKYCKWYKIPVKNIDQMYDMSDYDKYTVIHYPMLCYYSYIAKYGYYTLGYKCDKQGKLMYLVYAIPGSKDRIEQPYGGKTGFVTWVPDKDNRTGYWLMFYDFKKSCVVIPVKK